MKFLGIQSAGGGGDFLSGLWMGLGLGRLGDEFSAAGGAVNLNKSGFSGNFEGLAAGGTLKFDKQAHGKEKENGNCGKTCSLGQPVSNPIGMIGAMTKRIFTMKFKARLAELPAAEQLWLSDELFLLAISLRRRASRNKKSPVPKYFFRRQWRN